MHRLLLFSSNARSFLLVVWVAEMTLQVGPKLLRKAMAPPARKPPKWKGIGGGQRGQIVVKEETPDHDVIFMDRWGQRRGK